MKAIVTKSTGSWYDALTEEGKFIRCRIKGKLRLKDFKHTNPVTVGDHVIIDIESGDESAAITEIEPRKNYIIRKASNLSKQTHIIASNIDLAVLVASFAAPQTSTGFIDRFLVTAEAYHIPACIVFNKIDLLNDDLLQHADEIANRYRNIGYEVIYTSVINHIGIDTIKKILHEKVTLLTGHSGVGKSSLLNSIDNSLQIKTGSISNYHQKGQHTTTFAEMHRLASGGFIIDTPGIREFGIVDIEDEELSHYFKEMKSYIGKCKFNNCLHTNEPGCAIKEAVIHGSISEERYASYVSILANEDLYA